MDVLLSGLSAYSCGDSFGIDIAYRTEFPFDPIFPQYLVKNRHRDPYMMGYLRKQVKPLIRPKPQCKTQDTCYTYFFF